MLFRRYDTTPDSPLSFGYKIDWLAVQSVDTARLVDSLALRKIKPANWREGLQVSRRHVFVAPAVDGWQLVVNFRLAESGAVERLAAISSDNDARACFFGSHRGVTYHAWGRAQHGVTERLYMHADGVTYYDFGPRTRDEIALEVEYWDGDLDEVDEEKLAGEETVIALASRWSLDPTTLAERHEALGVGLIGKVS